MTAVYDHLVAVMLVGAVLLILIGVSRGTTRSSIGAAQTLADATALSDLDALIEADLGALGAGVPSGQPVILDYAWTGPARRFVFLAADAAGAVRPVRYTLTASTGSACPAGGPCFEFARSVDRGSGFAADGGSAALVKAFDLDLISPSGVPDEARAAALRMVLLPRFSDGATESVRERVWERRIPLLNLRFRQSV